MIFKTGSALHKLQVDPHLQYPATFSLNRMKRKHMNGLSGVVISPKREAHIRDTSRNLRKWKILSYPRCSLNKVIAYLSRSEIPVLLPILGSKIISSGSTETFQLIGHTLFCILIFFYRSCQ